MDAGLWHADHGQWSDSKRVSSLIRYPLVSCPRVGGLMLTLAALVATSGVLRGTCLAPLCFLL